jgi:SulP family sulfate permease
MRLLADKHQNQQSLMPNFSFSTFSTLASEAFAIALLGLIEAVSISRAVAAKSNQRINPNQEFVGHQIISNE